MIRDTAVFNQSIEVAQEIFDHSLNLRSMDSKVDYWTRDAHFTELLGVDGHMTFTPNVSLNIVEPFKDIMEAGLEQLRQAYYEETNYELTKTKSKIVSLAEELIESLTTEHMLSNTVSGTVTEQIERTLKDRYTSDDTKKIFSTYKSPKLSKLLVKLWGEQHNIVKYFTSKCPKSITKGLNHEWDVTVSIMPHHIAGMSYYGSLNHGGKKWQDGYNGTSCMCTKQNSSGEGIFGLVPCLRDETMAVAYLSKSSDKDIWNPIYQARVLLRVLQINGNPFVIACRSYAISNEATHILIDGLKNQFGNVHFAREMEGFLSSSKSFKLKREYAGDISYAVSGEVTCPKCNGEGNLGNDEDGDSIYCDECDGDGHWDVNGDHLPYIDNDEFMDVNDEAMYFTIPVSYLNHVGIMLSDDEVVGDSDNDDDSLYDDDDDDFIDAADVWNWAGDVDDAVNEPVTATMPTLATIQAELATQEETTNNLIEELRIAGGAINLQGTVTGRFPAARQQVDNEVEIIEPTLSELRNLLTAEPPQQAYYTDFAEIERRVLGVVIGE
jgi:hypothetical protein